MPAGEIISALFRRKGSPLAEGHFLSELNRVWEDLAGEAIASAGRPVRFKSRRLFVALPSSACIQDMYFIEEPLRQKINSRFPDKKIKKIVFQLKPRGGAFPLLKPE